MTSAAVEQRLRRSQGVLGRKWHPLIVYHLLDAEPLGFSAIESRLSGVSSKVLSDSLADLDEKGIVRRHVRQDRPPRVDYSLTDRGRALDPVIRAMIRWGEEADTGPER